jgi:hypothetical protein
MFFNCLQNLLVRDKNPTRPHRQSLSQSHSHFYAPACGGPEDFTGIGREGKHSNGGAVQWIKLYQKALIYHSHFFLPFLFLLAFPASSCHSRAGGNPVFDLLRGPSCDFVDEICFFF